MVTSAPLPAAPLAWVPLVLLPVVTSVPLPAAPLAWVPLVATRPPAVLLAPPRWVPLVLLPVVTSAPLPAAPLAWVPLVATRPPAVLLAPPRWGAPGAPPMGGPGAIPPMGAPMGAAPMAGPMGAAPMGGGGARPARRNPIQVLIMGIGGLVLGQILATVAGAAGVGILVMVGQPGLPGRFGPLLLPAVPDGVAAARLHQPG